MLVVHNRENAEPNMVAKDAMVPAREVRVVLHHLH
jgi:hypothetical protein